MDTRENIKRIFSDGGFPVMGVAAFSPELFRRAGKPDTIYEKLAPKSFMIAAIPYYSRKYERQNIAKYATVPDYMKLFGHKIEYIIKKLKKTYPESKFLPLCNVDPFSEVKIAQAAGLGTRGRHGLIINPEYGSYLTLGHVVTDMAVTPDSPLEYSMCTGCNLCVRACPAGALSEEGVFNRHKCVAHINQKNGSLELWQEELIVSEGRLWGCDICQDACPKNKEPKKTYIPEFLDESRHIPYLSHENVKNLKKEEFVEDYADRVFLSKNSDNIWRNLKLF